MTSLCYTLDLQTESRLKNFLFVREGPPYLKISLPTGTQSGLYIKQHPSEEWSTVWGLAGCRLEMVRTQELLNIHQKRLLFPGAIPTNFSWWFRALFYFLIMENAPIFNANMTTGTNTITEIICTQLSDIDNDPKKKKNQDFKGLSGWLSWCSM